jgi:hypothetical protein
LDRDFETLAEAVGVSDAMGLHVGKTTVAGAVLTINGHPSSLVLNVSTQPDTSHVSQRNAKPEFEPNPKDKLPNLEGSVVTNRNAYLYPFKNCLGSSLTSSDVDNELVPFATKLSVIKVQSQGSM